MENIKLLDEVITNRLELVKEFGKDSDDGKQAFKEAMEAMDRRIQLEKMSSAKEEQKKVDVLKIVEIAVPVGMLILDFAFKTHYMKTICNFEKDYTFTTTPGRSISGLFKFKR